MRWSVPSRDGQGREEAARREHVDERLHELFREMLLIRRFEEKVEALPRGRAVRLPPRLHRPGGGRRRCSLRRLGRGGRDRVDAHRAHGHTISKGTHVNAVMAELYGKQEGCSRGYGGSMHLYDLEHGNLGANAAVGGGLAGDRRRRAGVPVPQGAAGRGRLSSRRPRRTPARSTSRSTWRSSGGCPPSSCWR